MKDPKQEICSGVYAHVIQFTINFSILQLTLAYSYLVGNFMIVRVEGRDGLRPNSKHSLVPVTIATTMLHHNTVCGIHRYANKFTKPYCTFKKRILLRLLLRPFILYICS